jgi:hypothetical protein
MSQQTQTMPRVWLSGGGDKPEPRRTDRTRLVLSDGRNLWEPDLGGDGWQTLDGRHHAEWGELRARYDLVEVSPSPASGDALDAREIAWV